MNRKTTRDFVIFGLILLLLYKRQGTRTDVILRDANGNPIFPFPLPDYPPTPTPAPVPQQITYGQLHPEYQPAPGSIDVSGFNVPQSYFSGGNVDAGDYPGNDYGWLPL